MNVNNFLGVKKDSGPFSPIDLSPNLWIDPSDATTVTSSGGNISQIDDKSGNSNDVSAPSVSQEPLDNLTINSLQAINFATASNKRCLVINRGGNADNWQDVYVVCKWNGGNSAWNGIISANAGGTGAMGYGIGLQFEGNTNEIYGFTWSNQFYVNAELGDFNTDYVNGGVLDNVGMISFSRNTAVGVSGINLGNGRTQTDASFDGLFGEVVCFDTKLADADREKMEGYLAHKWGFTSQLPTLHPYKSVEP